MVSSVLDGASSLNLTLFKVNGRWFGVNGLRRPDLL
jgi:hypothetical protein